MATREPIYAALAALVFNHPLIAADFVTTGRWIRHFEQLPAGANSCPAIYLVQHPGEKHERAGEGIPVTRTLQCHFVMYFNSPDPFSVLPATQCNTGLDAIDQAINNPGNPQNVQTLGGLVKHVYTEGAVAVDEGLLQEFSLCMVPITILIP